MMHRQTGTVIRQHPFRARFAAACALALFAAIPANAQFVEPDVETIEIFLGDQVGDAFGWAAENVGDVDGDGADDFLISGIARDGFGGRAVLYSGATGVVLNDVRGASGEVVGFSLGATGDVDGDGIPDYAIGGATAAVYSGADHQIVLPLAPTTGFGSSLTGVGDVDGDGHADLLVGSQRTSVTFPDAGRVVLVSGADGSVRWTRDGVNESAFLGSSVGSLGDVNGDGIPDVLAGSVGAGEGGEVYVLDGSDGTTLQTLTPLDPTTSRAYGQYFASGTGDIDFDGVPDIFVADFDEGSTDEIAGTGRFYLYSGATGDLIRTVGGLNVGDGLGPGRGIPDVNGDGVPDIVVAAYTNSDGAPFAGAASRLQREERSPVAHDHRDARR